MYLLKISPEYQEDFWPYIPESLHEGLFLGDYRAVGCICEGKGCGAVVLSGTEEESLCWIKSVFVDPKVRKKGLGKLLIQGAAKTAFELGAAGLAVRFIFEPGEQEAFEAFLKGCGFQDFRNSALLYSCTLGELAVSPFMARYARFTDHLIEVRPFNRLRPEELEDFHSRYQHEIPPYLRAEASVGLDPEVSFAGLQEGKITGYILVTRNQDTSGKDSLEISSAVVFGHNRGITGTFPALVSSCLNAVLAKYAEETVILVQALNNTVNGIASRFTAGIRHGERREMEGRLWFGR